MDAQGIFSDTVGGVVLVIIAGLFIYILVFLGNELGSLSGSAVAQNITNYGILAIGAIVTISGLAGLIKFAQWVSEAFEGVGF